MEREPQREPIKQNCSYCGPGFPATWAIITDQGQEFVCGKHYLSLDASRKIQQERLLEEAEWMLNSHYEEDLAKHEFDDTDQWEDGSMYGF